MAEIDSKTTPLKRLWKVLGGETKAIYLILGYAAFAGVVSLSLPLGIQAIINFVQAGQLRVTMVVLITLVLIGVIFAGLLNYMQMRIAEDIQQRLYTKSSFEFIYRFPRIITAEFGRKHPPELANRFFDTMTIQKGIPKMIIDFSTSTLQIIFGLILLSFYHPFFILFGVLLIVLFYVVFQFSAPIGLSTNLVVSKYKYDTAHWIQEVARNTDSFKVSGSSKLASSKQDKIVHEYLHAREDHFKILRLQYFKMIGFKVLVVGALLIIGGFLVINQQMNIGQFVAAEVVVLLMTSSVEKLIKGLENVYDVLTGLEKIGYVTDKKLENSEGISPLKNSDTFIWELNDLGITYPNADHKALKNIKLKIDAGESIFVDGSSGSGKTTLLKVIGGLEKYSEGNLYVNNYSLKTIQIDHYRSFVGHSLIGNLPFEGSIRENICFNNPDVTDRELAEVIEHLKLKKFVNNQELSVDSLIATAGRNIPYTVAKKIMLARAVITKPKLLLLKDPLVEFQEDEVEEIIEYLFDKSHPWTLMVVSRNKLWKQKCKRIIYLENGEIINKN